MKNFNVKITDDRENVNLYRNASSINVSNDKIEVEQDGERTTHQMCYTDEIIIKPNH